MPCSLFFATYSHKFYDINVLYFIFVMMV